MNKKKENKNMTLQQKINKELKDKNAYIKKTDLIKRFVEADNFFNNTPWTLKQIIENICLTTIYEKGE